MNFEDMSDKWEIEKAFWAAHPVDTFDCEAVSDVSDHEMVKQKPEPWNDGSWVRSEDFRAVVEGVEARVRELEAALDDALGESVLIEQLDEALCTQLHAGDELGTHAPREHLDLFYKLNAEGKLSRNVWKARAETAEEGRDMSVEHWRDECEQRRKAEDRLVEHKQMNRSLNEASQRLEKRVRELEAELDDAVRRGEKRSRGSLW